jgi:hypothetical protein
VKIRISAAAVLVAASVLTALAPSQAFAAPQAPPCTKKNIAYIDAQDRQEDAEAKVTAAEPAAERARADSATLDRAAAAGDYVINHLNAYPDMTITFNSTELRFHLQGAARAHDPAATADAAVKLADAAEKVLTDAKITKDVDHIAYKYLAGLRSAAEDARKATEAPNVEARQSDLNAARAKVTEAAKKVRPARDAYRNCLDNLVS